MSFPGYLKSLKLRDVSSTEVEESANRAAGWPSHGSVHASRKRLIDSSAATYSPEQPDAEVVVLDERGNGPKRSLWVGNIPPRTTSSELRDLFRRFGKIESTKPHAKYAFVNFETLGSAIAAFKKYHDKDIFKTGNSTINIRFTTNIAESKQVKVDVQEQKSSISMRAEAAQKYWFQPATRPSNDATVKTPVAESWPNGLPPTGPKSQLQEISPPPLRRGDSYRPAELKRGDSYRSDKYRRPGRDDYGRGRSSYRHSDQHYSPPSSPRYSRSTSRSSSSKQGSQTPSLEDDRNRNDESPLPWERVRSEAQPSKYDQRRSPKGSNRDHNRENDLSNSDIRAEGRDAVESANSDKCWEPDTNVKAHVSEQRKQPTNTANLDLDRDEQATTIPHEVRARNSSSTSTLHPAKFSGSPVSRSLGRLVAETESLRASAAPSEAATTSTKTSGKKRRCHDCRKSGSDLSPLVPCSKCKRRFHTGCGDPRPSVCVDLSDYVCGGCRRSQKTDASREVATADITLLIKSKDRVHLVSPPLSFSHDGNDSAHPSPHNNNSRSISDDYRMENFFRDQSTISDSQANSARHCLPQVLQDKEDPYVRQSFDNQAQPQPQSQLRCSSVRIPTSPKQSSNQRNLSALMNKYKVVTCKWWAAGSCTQPEEGCYYAHHPTSINLPDRKKVNKNWTCFDWLQGKCPLPEQDCLHAHKDTGLHVWQDGRPSFKHVTCYWWLKGRCKWAQDSCKLAHKDTGFYSMDPSETWQGGAKFSTTRPALDGPPRPFLIRRGTGVSVSITHSHPGSEMVMQGSSVPESSARSNIGSASNSTPTKPALTINTSAQLPLTDQSQFFVRGGRPFLKSIGGPPETPSAESPEKANNNGYDGSANKFPFRREPDLPTPGLDDDQLFEASLQGQIQTQIQTPIENSWKKIAIGRQIAETEKEVSSVCNSINEEVRQRRGRANNSTSGAREDLISGNDEASNDVTRDPRLQRQGKPLEQHVSVSSGDNVLTAIGTEQSTELPAVPETTKIIASSPGDDSSRRGVKKCQVCRKTVFGSDLCRVCSSKKDVALTAEIPSKTEYFDLTGSTPEKRNSAASKVTDVLINDLGPTVPLDTTIPDAKQTLKRSASGNNMFLKNKRPKSSMMFSSSGSIRPDAFRRPSISKRPLLGLATSETRREAQPTLDDLITKERMKNNNKRNDSIEMIDDLSSKVEPERDEQIVHDQSKSPVTQHLSADVPTKQVHPSPIIVSQIIESGGLFSSPRSSPGIPLAETRINVNQRLARVTNDKSRSTRSPQRPSREISQWRTSESPQPNPVDTESYTSKETTSRKDTSSRTSVASEVIFEQEFRKPTMPPLLRHTSSHDMTISPGKFSWASAITCTHCQKNHKKCLHGDGGVLSAVKCRDYVLSRRGKPDTGRPRYEWNAIMAASELDPESESESEASEDERVGAESDALCTEESDDDFLTAIGGDEVIDQPEAFVNNSKRSPLKMAPPTTLSITSPVRSKQFSNPLYMSHKAPDSLRYEQHLRKRGVMFESDSEEEDYLSDEYDAPLQQKRNIDPMFVPPKFSRDLFELAPHLNHGLVEIQETACLNRPPRPSRKEQWANLKARQLQERRELFGNPHWEIDRVRTDVIVSARVERVLPPPNPADRFAVGARLEQDEDMTFSDFLGAPKLPEICLMADGERLGFRDGQKERDRIFGRTGRGLGKRETDDDKWPVRQK